MRNTFLESAPPPGARVSPIFVVGIDHSPMASEALRVAAGLARQFGASLVLLHIAAIVEPATCNSPSAWIRAERAARGAGEKLLRDALLVAEDVVLAYELHFGDPTSVICRRATELGAVLVVIGTSKRGFLGRLGIGGVSAAVSSRAPCSVLIVRTPSPGSRAAAGGHESADT